MTYLKGVVKKHTITPPFTTQWRENIDPSFDAIPICHNMKVWPVSILKLITKRIF